MTIIGIPPANPAHTTADRRTGFEPRAATSIRPLRRRLAMYLRDAVRDRQPMVTLSEQVISDIHNVHSVHR